MRSSGRMYLAGLAFALCAAAACVASAAEKEPVTGGLLSVPGEAIPVCKPTAPPEAIAPKEAAAPARKLDDTSWGLLVRGGYFGLPNFIADELFYKHPTVTGYSVGAEIRYHGDTGGRGVSSVGLAVDSAAARTDGEWQNNETSKVVKASGDISMLAITLTSYWSLFPSWYVHPYIGIGIGVAHVKGFYKNDIDRFDADIWIPALHIPVGLAVEFGKRFQLTAEGRFINGIALGGALQVRF